MIFNFFDSTNTRGNDNTKTIFIEEPLHQDLHNAAEIQDFPFDKYFVKKDTNRFDNYSLYALYAAQEAVNHAGLDVEALDKDRFGVIVASGIGGIKEIEDQVLRLNDKGPKRVKPLTLPKAFAKYGFRKCCYAFWSKRCL